PDGEPEGREPQRGGREDAAGAAGGTRAERIGEEHDADREQAERQPHGEGGVAEETRGDHDDPRHEGRLAEPAPERPLAVDGDEVAAEVLQVARRAAVEALVPLLEGAAADADEVDDARHRGDEGEGPEVAPAHRALACHRLRLQSPAAYGKPRPA